MQPLSVADKRKLITVLPFPLSHLYQELLVGQRLIAAKAQPTRKQMAQLFWKLQHLTQLLSKTVAIFAVSDYLSNKDHAQEKSEVYATLLESFSSVAPQWLKIAKIVLTSLAEQQTMFPDTCQLPDLLELTSATIYLEQSPPEGFPAVVSPRKAYHWFDLMDMLEATENHLFRGIYRFRLPGSEIVAFYIDLLGMALKSCTFFEQHGIYVLATRDDRKVRGFLCQGTRSQPVGIRQLSNALWHSLKSRAFLYTQSHKRKYLSLFPLIVPQLQKHGELTVFCDLLAYEYGTREKMYFYGSRMQKLLPHHQCAPNALGVWQKELRWLERYTSKTAKRSSYILAFDELANYHTRDFVGRHTLFNTIFSFLKEHSSGYFYLTGRSGYGKTSLLCMLYRHSLRETYSQLGIAWENRAYPVFVWHFCGDQSRNDDPTVILKSLYGQILQKVYEQSETVITSQLQKLPMVLDNLQHNFEKLLEQTSKELLQPKNFQLVVVLDGLDENNLSPTAFNAIVSCLPLQLPPNVVFLLTFDTCECGAGKTKGMPGKDRQPFFYLQAIGAQMLQLPGVSPLEKFNQLELQEWVGHHLALSEAKADLTSELVWQRSELGDPFYLSLLKEAIASGLVDLDSPQSVPYGRYGLLARLWESLADLETDLPYRILGLLAEMRQYAGNQLLSAMMEQPLPEIEKNRWHLNRFLRYEGDAYMIAHPLLRSYIRAQLNRQDRQNFHRELTCYYSTGEDGQKIFYKRLQDEALRNLAYHYYHANEWENLYALAIDNDFKEEKLKRFKVYQEYLGDVTLALKAAVEQKQYAEVLGLGYRYSEVASEALHGLAHAFRIASQRNYELALERIRIIRDEQDLFRAILVVLWHALYNEDSDQANLVLEELGRIPDEQIGFCMKGIESFVLFLLKKIQKHGLARIDHLIGKHGLKGREAVDYLLKLNAQIGFSKDQFKYFFQKLRATAQGLLSSKDKKEALDEMVALVIKAERFARVPEMWRQVLAYADGITDVTLRLDALKNLGNAILTLTQKEHFEQFATVVAKVKSLVEGSDNKAVHFAQYAGLFRLIERPDDYRRYIEESFQYVERQKPESLEEFFRIILYELEETKEILPREWSDKIFVLLRKMSDESHKMGLVEIAVVSLAYRGELNKAFKLLNQGAFTESPGYFATLKKIIRYLKSNETSPTLPYWNMVLDQIAYLTNKDYGSELLQELLLSLMQLKIAESDPIWNRYVAVVNRLKDLGGAYERDQIFAKLACGFAEKGYLDKTREVLAMIVTAELRSEPLADFAIQWIRKKTELAMAIDVLKEIVLLKEQLRLLNFIANHIPSGDAGRGLWKRVTVSLRHLNWQGSEAEGWDLYFIKIISKLMEDLPLDESGPFWEDIFSVIHGLPYEDADAGIGPAYTANIRELPIAPPKVAGGWNPKLKLLEEIIFALGKCGMFEKTTFFWPMVENSILQLNFPHGKARLEAAVAIAMVQLGQIWEANDALEKAYDTVRQETNPVLVLEVMAKIASGYRELGKETRCREIFEQILRYSGLSEGKKIKNWDPHEFIISLEIHGLEDLGLLMAEKMILAVVDIGEESPPPESLLNIAGLCVATGSYNEARQIFLRLLPLLSKEGNLTGETPLYLQIVEQVGRIAEEVIFRELWERTAEMVLNFPRVAMQEHCLDLLSGILSSRGDFAKYRTLWDKLLSHASYIGNQFEAMRSHLRICKHLATIAPWEIVSDNFYAMWNKIAQVASEYDQIHLIEMAAEMLIAFPQFDKATLLWNELTQFARKFKRQDCLGMAVTSLAKILAKRIRERQEWHLAAEVDRLVEQIAKPQQKCEGYLIVAKEYQLAGAKEACTATLRKVLDLGRSQGAFYQNKILPSVIECLFGLGEYEAAQQNGDQLQDPLARISLGVQAIALLEKQGRKDQAGNLLAQMIPAIKTIEPQYGDQARIYAKMAISAGKIKGIASAIALLDKAFLSWDAIMNSNYQKDAVAALATSLQGIGRDPQLLPIWRQLTNKARTIEQDIHRFWALQEIAKGLARSHEFAYLFDVIALLPPFSEVRFNVLAAYIQEAELGDCLALLKILPSEQRIAFIRKLAVRLEAADNLEELLQLWLEMPGNFVLLCDLTTKILSVALKTRTHGTFSRWFAQVALHWGLLGKEE